jgi:PAS domain S-box-containing protein
MKKRAKNDISMMNEPLYNSRIIQDHVEYITKYHPEMDVDNTLSYAGISRHELEDPGHWFNQLQVNRFHEILVRETGCPDISREVGRYAAYSKTSSVVRQYALGLLSPASVYRMLDAITPTLSRGSEFKTRKLSDNSVEVKVTVKPGVAEQEFQCENRTGLLESVAKIFTNTFAKIEHPRCIHRGDPSCDYIISWEKTSALAWKRAAKILTLLGSISALVFLFILPPLLFLIYTLLFCSIVAFTLLKAAYIDHKDFKQTIQNQGYEAKKLIDEMNMRYSNSLLIQEVGQAASGIRDVNTLCVTIVNIMEKYLDFDRGMIMLTTEDKQCLVHIAGFGYSPTQQSIIDKAQFNLDNPTSQGIFVRAFKDQKPFLVNDLSQELTKMSEKSLDLAKQMNVHSLICVPIINEKESLGILAVDNVASKRMLTQSDMNLLMGVASQLAVHVSETIALAKLQESERKYRELVENANSIILRMNTEGYITFFNEYAQRFFGYTEEEMLGENIRGKLLSDDHGKGTDLEDLLRELTRTPEPSVVHEKTYLLRDGRKVWIAWTNKPIFDEEGNLTEILSIGNDLTGLRQAALEKEALEFQLQEAQKMEAIGTLAGGIAHDFNNILQAIFGYTQILLMKTGPEDEGYKYLAAMERSVQRASDLTKRLLIFSRKVESQLRPMDLGEEVIQVAKILERTIPKMIQIKLDLADNLDIINADSVQIEQILMNFGINSRDAMPEGGLLIFKTCNITLNGKQSDPRLASAKGKYVLLSVSDTGQGINNDIKDHIFEPFFTTKDQGKGTGLGLAVVYGIVQSHNGYITCDTEENKGTTFNIYLPVLNEPYVSGDYNTIEKKLIPEKGTGTVLIVDDDDSIRKPTEELLKHFGYNVITANDGESALKIYKEKKYNIDLIILDLIMPGMGGKQCMNKILNYDPSANIIVASGHSADESINQAVADGAKGFLGKPWDMRKMLNLVSHVINNK